MGVLLLLGAAWWLWAMLGSQGLIAALVIVVGTLLCVTRT